MNSISLINQIPFSHAVRQLERAMTTRICSLEFTPLTDIVGYCRIHGVGFTSGEDKGGIVSLRLPGCADEKK